MSVLVLIVAVLSAQENQLDQLLRDLDERAAAYGKKLGGPDTHVAALVSRRFARRLDKDRDYVSSTYNFTHATRDDHNKTRNRWDLILGDKDEISAMNSLGRIFPMGKVGFEKLILPHGPLPEGNRSRVALEGHLYVVHTENAQDNFWTKLEILELEASRWIIFRWQTIKDPATVDPLERSPIGELKTPRVRLQLHSGAHRAHNLKAFMHHKTTSPLTVLKKTPLDLEIPFGSRTGVKSVPQRSFIEGGYIPKEKIWVIRRIEYSGRVATGGTGSFNLHVGDRWVVRRTNKRGAFKRVWKGWILVRPGEERLVYAEIVHTGKCDVVISGEFHDVKQLKDFVVRDLTEEERKKVSTVLVFLDDDDVSKREEATHRLMEMGQPIMKYLESTRSKNPSKEFQTRLTRILKFLAEGEITP